MSRINDLVYPVISLNARPPPMPRELIIRVSVEEEMPNGYYLQIPPGAYL
ncbi:hypothetical protein Vdis_0487 [Vulcanisaeta distributa DSM 14429]|uniref:Uncharacterized protein n=2 Tax=Vulcanisaeta distributa TaxID=164451 RepID=E1QUG0_VULDI|nr:hypothetical protein Vdis_0487 [Vulcanisaeta distributa DSM 14429]